MENVACLYVEPLEAVDIGSGNRAKITSVGRPVTSIFATGCDVHARTHAHTGTSVHARMHTIYVYARR